MHFSFRFKHCQKAWYRIRFNQYHLSVSNFL